MSKTSDVEKLRAIVAVSTTRREVLEALGLKPAGGNYAMLKRELARYAIDTSHFVGQGWNAGKSLPTRVDVQDYLRQGSTITSHHLRQRLIRDGIFEAKCYRCLRTEWQGQPIPLELEHVNGIHDDNRLENLTILCPNCHALTPTYRSKNRSKNSPGPYPASSVPRSMACLRCGEPCVYKYCSAECVHLSQRKTVRPSREELAALVATKSILAIGRQYGVSDNAVRKWLKAYGLR
jgi:hypothetical protein